MTRLTADLFPRRGRHPNRKTSEYSAIRRSGCAPARDTPWSTLIITLRPVQAFSLARSGAFMTCPPRVGLRLYACRETVLGS
jgi:hypothetical protein